MKEIYTPPLLVIHEYDTYGTGSNESRDNAFVDPDEMP